MYLRMYIYVRTYVHALGYVWGVYMHEVYVYLCMYVCVESR